MPDDATSPFALAARETIYTLDGQFKLQLAEALLDVSPGSFVFIPRGTAHTWQNVGDAPGRLLATIVPADRKFEQLFSATPSCLHKSAGPRHSRDWRGKPKRSKWLVPLSPHQRDVESTQCRCR
jgi:uncharacterized cupin superfamily protein